MRVKKGVSVMARAQKNTVTAEFEFDRDTKNTIRFAEKVEGPLGVPAIGTIYIPKGTLATMGYAEGQGLTVSVAAA